MAFLNPPRVLLACAFVAAWLLGPNKTARAAGCPPQSITVASGGTAVTDLGVCAASGIDGYQNPPQHGVNDVRNSNLTGLVYYTNNGDGSTTDSFIVINGDDYAPIPFTVTVTQPGPGIGTSTLPNPVVGTAYSQSLAATGGSTPYSWTLTGGALPAGLNLSPSGIVGGTPTQAGSANPVFTVTDSANRTASRTIPVTVATPALAIVPPTLPSGMAGSAYSQTLAANGGTAPYSYAVIGGTPPPGITVSSAGNIGGTPTTPGSFTFTVGATDSSTGTGAPFSATRTFTLAVNAPTVTVAPATLPNPAIGQAYSQTVSALDGMAPYSFAVTGGALPAGLSLDAGGTLGGMPTSAGTFNFVVSASDSGGFIGSRAYTITVAAPTLTLVPASLPAATVGASYSQTLVASGGAAPYSYAITAGSTPSGITLSAAGVLSGTSTVAGNFTFTIVATDSSTGAGAPFSGARSYSLTVAAPAVVVAPTTLPDPTVGQAYSQIIAANGGTAPHAFAITAGALPPGISLSSAGTLSGASTTAGAFNFTVTATDAGGFTGNRAYALSSAVAPPIASNVTLSVGASLPANPVPLALSGGTATSVQVVSQATHGTAAASGTSITYTPNPGFAGSDSFTYIATNASGASVPAIVTVTVAPATNADLAGLVPSVSTLSPALSPGADAYTVAVPNTQGSISLTPTVADPAATVTVNGAVVASGSASAPITLGVGATSIPVVVTAQSGSTNIYTVTVTRAASAVATLANLVPSKGTLNPAFASPTPNYTLSLPTAQTTFSLTPTLTDAAATLTVNGAPVASGEASAAIFIPVGTATVTVVVTAADSTTTRSYVVNVTRAAPAIALQPAAGLLPEAASGSPYSLTLTPSGGTAPYTFAVTAGALPDRLVLDPAKGTITGTPIAAGEANFTITVTDTSGASSTLVYRLVVKTAPVVAVSQSQTIDAGTTTTVDLTAGATGGPFTDARLISLTPPDAGAAAIILAETAAADDESFAEAVRKRRYALKFTPHPSFTGRAVATFTLSSALGTSASATVTFLIAPRADPSKDADVIGLLTAQVDASRRFAKDQTRNFNNRLEQLHDEGERRHSSMDVHLGYNPRGESEGLGHQRMEVLHRLDEDQAERMNEALPGLLTGYRPEDGEGPHSRRDSVAGDARDPRDRDHGFGDPATPELNLGRFAVWSGGYVNFGDRDTAGLDLDYTTVGVSGGVDYRFSPSLVAGFGVGYGRDAADIGDRGTGSRGNSYSAAVYGSWKPLEGLYLDGLVGGGHLDFDSLRFVTGDGSPAEGERYGRQVFGSLAAGYEQRRGNWLLSPYGRMEIARSWLDGFLEVGPRTLSLTYGKQSVDMIAGVLGVRGFYAFDMDWGVLKPGFRTEYTHDFAGDGEVALGYTDIGTSRYSVRTDASEQDYAMLGLSIDADFATRWTAGFDYRTSFGRETQNHAFGFKVGTRF